MPCAPFAAHHVQYGMLCAPTVPKMGAIISTGLQLNLNMAHYFVKHLILFDYSNCIAMEFHYIHLVSVKFFYFRSHVMF